MSNRRWTIALGAALHLALAAGAAAAEEPVRATPLRVVMFYSPTCKECKEAKEALAGSERRWGGRVRVERRELLEAQDFADLIAYEGHYGLKGDGSPKVFVGEKYLVGPKAIVDRLDRVIAEELAKGSRTFAPPDPAAAAGSGDAMPSAILDRFRSFGVGAVVAAGLVDGINPCAFATIVFFLSMLAYLGRSRRQLAGVGIGFTSAVFVTYFLLGLGLLGAVKAFSVSQGISAALAYGVAALAFALAGWSLIDAVRYARTGDVKKVTLVLPGALKSRIRRVIRVGLSTRGVIVGSVAIGFLVAVLESVCTGQVYLPTIVLVARAPGMRGQAVGYLLLYNLMFIAPLVGILVIAYLGVRSERLGDFLTRHLAAFKLAMAALFAALGGLVLATV